MTVRLLLMMLLSLSVSVFAQAPPIEPGVSQELAKWRAARYSDVRYKLNLTLEKMSPVLKGTIEIKLSYAAETCSECPPRFIDLDWRKIRGHEEKSTISNVTINGKLVQSASFSSFPAGVETSPGSGERDKSRTLNYFEHNEHLIFSDGVVMGENVIKLDFTSPILTSGSAITRYVDKEDGSEYLYSLFVPSDASTAFPVFDQPDIKSRFSLSIVAPPDWSIVTNSSASTLFDVFDGSGLRGKPQNLRGPLFKTISFEETKPISTYVFAFAAGPFERVEGPASRSVPPAVAGRSPRRIETSRMPSIFPNSSQEGRFTPALDSSQDSGGKPAFLTEIGSGEERNVSGSNDSIQPPATAGGTDIGGERVSSPRVSSPHVSKGSGDGSGARGSQEPSLTVGLRTPETSIYVRRSQAAKFKPHAAEVFRLNREAVKYFEEYFDYKFPFPKYDLVLIPEFPFGGMEHAGATFLREASIIFPQEPTKNDHISRATLIFHEAAHQWFGDTVTMRWFDDLWLKEGFATFTAYKAMEKIMPEMNAWKVFYERVKQAAYQTDSTKGTTAIYQPIANLSAAKSAYGNIVYNKAPAFLRQAEFSLGEDKFQAAVRAFLKKHEFGNSGWEDLVGEFETTSKHDLSEWSRQWVLRRGVPLVRVTRDLGPCLEQQDAGGEGKYWQMKFRVLYDLGYNEQRWEVHEAFLDVPSRPFRTPVDKILARQRLADCIIVDDAYPKVVIPNYQDYGYGIFLLDEKSRDYVLKNIQIEKDPFLRSMMWGALWDSVREGELDPREFVELVVRVQSASFSSFPAGTETSVGNGGRDKSRTLNVLSEDESTTALLLSRVGTAMNYYIDADKSGGKPAFPTAIGGVDLRSRVEEMLIAGMRNAPTQGQRITFYRAFLNVASSEKARGVLKAMLNAEPPASAGGKDSDDSRVKEPQSAKASASPPAYAGGSAFPLRTKDKFDIVTRLLILNDPDAPKLLADLERTETGDDAKRYAYAAKAGIPTAENKAKYWNDFVNNKDISESWIEAAFGPWNSTRHSVLTLGYLQKALQELPNHKRNRKIFFVNGWLGAFIGGQRSEEALAIVNKFLADNPSLDNDLRLKILENVDVIERAVKIRWKFVSR